MHTDESAVFVESAGHNKQTQIFNFLEVRQTMVSINKMLHLSFHGCTNDLIQQLRMPFNIDQSTANNYTYEQYT